MSKRKPSLGSVDYAYRCEVVRWLDGRTVEVVVNVRPFGRHFQVKLSLENGGKDCSQAEALAPRGTKVTAKLPGHESKPGIFVATIILPDGGDLGKLLSEP